MTYRAKHLPAWVRFRRKPEPLPVYTVPTEFECRLARIQEMALAVWAPRIDEQIRRLGIDRTPSLHWLNGV